MSENVRKLIGVAVMTAIVVVGVVATSGDDSDSSRTRNAAFAKGGVMTKEAPPVKGGDCCDETLYRLGQIEDRLSRIELALEANVPVERLSEEERARIEFGQARDALAVALDADVSRRWGEDWFDSSTTNGAVGSTIFESGLLYGVQVEVARAAVLQIGLGFEHRLADGEFTGEIARRGTRRDRENRAVVIWVETRNGIVETVRYRVFEPGN